MVGGKKKNSLKFREVWSEGRFGIINISVVVENRGLIHPGRVFKVGKPKSR